MQKKTCPNGHVYDPSIYGDQCPLCPVGAPAMGGGMGTGPETHIGSNPMAGPAPTAVPMGNRMGAPVPPPGGMHTHIAGANPGMQRPAAAAAPGDPAGATKYRGPEAAPRGGGHTVIRHAGIKGSQAKAPSRRLVGFLVTYSRDPNGRAFNIYEGRNFIGRDESCDIAIPDDDQMSGRHMSILYRNVDDKFKFRDEQSSNGTFVNKELLDDGELQNYDIIRAGSTIFIFIAVPSLS